jgi:hypothetical protein
MYASGAAAEYATVRHDPVPGILLAATAAIRVGETNDAVAWLDALEKAGGPPDGVLPLRIEAERARNMLESALMASLRWMEACPGQVGPIQEASELLMSLGRYDEAARLLDAVLSAA